MPRENPIIGSGRRGFGFEQKGFQERNLGLLLETLSKKETQKSIEALSKIEKDEWKTMSETATVLNSFVSLGGTSALVGSMTQSIKETIDLQIASVLSPLTNEFNQLVNDILSPILPLLQDIVNNLTAFISGAFDQFDKTNLPPAFYGGSYGSYYEWLQDNPTGSYNDYLAYLAGDAGFGADRKGGIQEGF